MNHDAPAIVPRPFPEGTVPLIAVEGTAFDCGAQYTEIVRKNYPGYRDYLNQLAEWQNLPREIESLFDRHSPFILDVVGGMKHADVPSPSKSGSSPPPCGCTSFSIAPSLTLDGGPISGQTKDTIAASAERYIVLRMKICGGPTLLILAYPGEMLGYGLWSTGMTLFRNALYSSAGGEMGLTMVQWGLLALSMNSIDPAVELALKCGIQGSGNCLLSDPAGRSASVEFNAGGVSLVPAENGISIHANHAVGEKTVPFLHIPHPGLRGNSFYRQRRLRELLQAEQGRLTAQKAMTALSDHAVYPGGICRHAFEDRPGWCTTAAIVAEPAKGKLHVTRGQPCSNWPQTYTL
jgi:isopenicillin-N N-acyltransferase like protein